MSGEDQAGVDAALDHLVNQFADPLSFLRELIQNAIDAGSQEVEIWLEEQQEEGDSSLLIIHIDDFGEGMNREIIDKRLTRLFSSGKDGDLTKIGKFGIGFASVFALEPDAVCVDTARGGENWRVLFRKDRSFVRIERDEPIEGTKIQVIKSLPSTEVESLRKRALEIVRYWCKHLDVEVRFDGEKINEPFDLDLRVKVKLEEQGTEIVAGYARGNETFCGFYNKGLTLLERQDSGFARVSFKVSSRYLEHTLTRDNVIEDDNYHKAMSLVESLIEGALVERLFELLDQEIRAGGRLAKARYLQSLVAWHLSFESKFPSLVEGKAILRSVDGSPLTLGDCRAASTDAKLFVAELPSPLSQAMQVEEMVVADLSSDGGGLLRSICGGNPPVARQAFCFPVAVSSEALLLQWAPLREATTKLLQAQGAKLTGLELGSLDYKGGGGWALPAISQKHFGELTPLAEARELGMSLLSAKRTLVVNADHPTVSKLITLAASEPELAAYTLAKLFFLGTKLDPALDGALGKTSVEGRWERLTS